MPRMQPKRPEELVWHCSIGFVLSPVGSIRTPRPASALEALPAREQAVFVALAREDDTPRVRRAAVARLDDPETLARSPKNDADEQVRTEAVARCPRWPRLERSSRRAVAAMA